MAAGVQARRRASQTGHRQDSPARALPPPRSAGAALPLRKLVARDRVLVPLLIRLLTGATPPQVARRAALILQHLASTPEAHDTLRAYEWMLMHLAMHEGLGCSAHANEVLEELCER